MKNAVKLLIQYKQTYTDSPWLWPLYSEAYEESFQWFVKEILADTEKKIVR